MMLLAKRVSALFPPEKRTPTSSAVECFLMRSKMSAAWLLVSIQVSSQHHHSALSKYQLAFRPQWRKRHRTECWVLSASSHVPLYALPTLILRNLAGAAPCPVPMTCWGWPLPQCGVPHKTHSSREQIASMEFQNSVVIPEYDGFFNMRLRLPFLISHPISQLNWKL